MKLQIVSSMIGPAVFPASGWAEPRTLNPEPLDLSSMKTDNKKSLSNSKGNSKYRCLSCGTAENMGRRKYCSIDCRQKLRYHLNLRTGLLRALNTRYATFYFTDSIIILDLLPYGSGEMFSYLYPRTHGRKPFEDYCIMSNILGNAWWAERNRTNKRYIATRHLLEKAEVKDADSIMRLFSMKR